MIKLQADKIFSSLLTFGRKFGTKFLMVFAATNMIMLAIVLMHPAFAQVVSLDLGGNNPGTVSGTVIQLVALMTVLSLAPSILIMMTSFTRIIVVLSFLRSAIGLQQTPPNTVMVSLAMFLTFFVMAPTFEAAYNQGVKPLIAEEIDETEAFNRSVEPFKSFMIKHVREPDLRLFMEISKTPVPKEPVATPLQVLVPAFMISELRRAFEIGFMLFLPFLVIDIVTSSILMSMGMMMLPPIVISLPFKIIFFVLVDGWNLVAGALIQSFDVPPEVAPILSAPPLAPGATPSP